jgi:ubiquinone/menaquinone biosynthesis C-methylase UbiE
MPKRGEIDYVRKLDADARDHAWRKPFSDPQCGQYLLNLGVVFTLLPPPPARILDLGVGTGWTSLFLARRGYQVVGVDIAPDMIKLSEQHLGVVSELEVSFVTADYETLPFRGEFDAALFFDSLHHAENEMAALTSAHRALKEGGVCLTVEPGRGHALAAAMTAAKFGVTEKDMPPTHIMELGHRLGFRESRVYARPDVYPVIQEPCGDGPAWSYLKNFVRNLAKAVVGPGRHKERWLHDSHIVWMRK